MQTCKKLISITRLLLILCPVFVFLTLLPASTVFAKVVTFEEKYTYQPDEFDSKLSCRVIASEGVKRLLMEKLAALIEPIETVKNLNMSKEEIAILLPGVVAAEPTGEKWDEKTCYFKARISADPEKVAQSLASLYRNTGKKRALKALKYKSDIYLSEIEDLKKELETERTNNKKAEFTISEKKLEQYAKAVKALSALGWLEKGRTLHNAGKYKEAIAVYTATLESEPNNAEAYARRGTAYLRMRDIKHALDDLGMAIKLDPQKADLYNTRGNVYSKSDNHRQAISDYDKAIELNPKHDEAYNNRGSAYAEENNLEQAIADYTTAIRLKPGNADAYNNRGNAYTKMGRINLAIDDYNNAIKHNPKHADAYCNRGFAYAEIGGLKLALKDLKNAAGLGNKRAKEFLNSQKMER